MGFSVGASILVARYIGAKDDKKVSKTVHTALSMALILGAVTAIAGYFISRPILSLMGADGALLELSTLYTQIYFFGAPFIAVTNYAAAIFNAKGDTKTPLYILSLSGLLNVLMNLVFVTVFSMSVEGVALATSFSNLASAIALVICLSKDTGACRFELKKLRIDKDSARAVIREGLPTGLQNSFFSISNIVVQSAVLRVNSLLVPLESDFAPVVNGNGATASLEMFVYAAITSVSAAAITFTSQHVGAKKLSRIRRVTAVSVILGMSLTVAMTAVIFILREPLLSLYDVKKATEGSLEAIAYNTAVTRMLLVSFAYPFNSMMGSTSGIAKGLGRSGTSVIISLIGACAFRVIWIMTVFNALPSLESVYLCYPITWVLTSLAQLTLALTTLNKMIAKEANNDSVTSKA
jgi:putative MATE family efflux protein